MNNIYENQIQSFKKYGEFVRTKKKADKMLMDNLLAQLAEANAAPVLNDVEIKSMLTALVDDVTNVKADTRFIKEIYTTTKKKATTPTEKKKNLRHSILSRGKKGV